MLRAPHALVLASLMALPALAGCLEGPGDVAPSAAGGGPGGAEAAYDPGWPALEDATLRPGDKLRAKELHVGANNLNLRGCTLNFVFTSPDNRSLYVGTASHCLSPEKMVDGTEAPHEVGDEWLLGGGVRATIAYCSWGAIAGSETCAGGSSTDEGHEDDFALLRVVDEDRAKVHPAVRHWGGPTGLLEAPPAQDARVLHYGNSFWRDATVLPADAHDAREGYVRESGSWHTLVRFVTPGAHGDSGSPVLTADGRALGLVQTLRVSNLPGENGVVNLAAALAAMAARGGPEVRLATWPQLTEGALPDGGAA